MIENNNIPLGTTRDSSGKQLTYKDCDGSWCEYTRDSFSNVLTYKDSGGYWYEYTRDEFGKELTYKISNYPDVLFIPLTESRYTLYLGDNGKYLAGCRYFTKEEAIAHWNGKNVNSKERANLFLEAIDKL